MSTGKRNRAWPIAIVLSVAVVGVLAAFIALAVQQPAPASAHDPAICHTPFAGLNPECANHDDGTPPANGGTPTPAPAPAPAPAPGTDITSDSSSGGGAPEFQVVINSLPVNLAVGSSIVLYLEDDYQEPATIPASSVYFVAESPTSEETGNGARVYTTIAPKIDTDAYFDADKSDISIRVFIPDMCTSSTVDCQGPNGVDAGQMLTMVVEDGSGIKNPTEAGSHSAAFKVLGPTASVPGPAAVNKDFELKTVAEIALSDVDNSRGYELTVTGSGFNDATTATAWVLGRKIHHRRVVERVGLRRYERVGRSRRLSDTDATMGTSPCVPCMAAWTLADSGHMGIVDDADTTKGYAEKGVCQVVIDKGTAVGSGLVGSDDKVAVSFEVTVPTFSAGKHNYICMNDGEDRQSDTDVEDFHLEPSIRVVPSTVSSGDTVNVFAQDYPFSGPALTQLKLAGIGRN